MSLTPYKSSVSDEELRQRWERGERLSQFMQSPFWMKDLKPYLDEENVKAGKDSLWSPASGMSKLEAVGLGAAYQGGKAGAIEDLFEWLAECKSKAVKAKQKLATKEESK